MFEELYQYLYHQSASGGIPLKGTGIVLGLALIGGHLLAWLRGDQTQRFLKAFPRHYGIGVAMMVLGLLWSILILSYVDMGEFFHLRQHFIWIVVAGALGMIFFVPEYLAVRALGSLMLLLASPVLTAAFLQPQWTRLLLPLLAYAWILGGLFLVGMPYLLRDWIEWATASARRWQLICFAGLAYGAVLVVFAVFTY
jgi:hypothetical protein